MSHAMFYKNNNIYLNNSEQTLKPKILLDAYLDYQKNFINYMGEKNEFINKLKLQLASLIECQKEEIFFTYSSSDSMEYLSLLLKKQFKQKDQIIIHHLTHGSSVLPWINLAKQMNLEIKWTNNYLKELSQKTKLLIFTQKFNTINDQEDDQLIKINDYIKKNNLKTIIINDAAQAITSEDVTLQHSDFLIFSAYKIFGPNGLGILAIKNKWLNKIKPIFLKTNNIKSFDFDKEYQLIDNYNFDKNNNLETIYVFSKWLDYYLFNKNLFQQKLNKLTIYCFEQMKKVKNIVIYNKKPSSILIFNLKNYHSQDLYFYLLRNNVILREGKHCVTNIEKYDNGLKSSLRLSLAYYNTKKEIDKLVELLNKQEQIFDYL